MAVGRKTVDKTQPTARVFSYGRNSSNVIVTADEALKVSTVWACLNYLSKTLGQLPWSVFTSTADGKLAVPSHPVNRILNVRPNREITPSQFVGMMAPMSALWGYAIAEIEWDAAYRPIALWPIHSSRVRPMRDIETGDLFWRVQQLREGVVDLDPMDVFYIPGFGDGPIGLSVTAFASECIGEARAQEIFGGSFFGQGTNPSGIVKVKGALDEPGLDELKNQFGQLYSGAANQNKVMFLDSDMDWTPLSTDPEKAQMVAARQHKVVEICRWFGIPPHKVMNLDRSTFANIEHQSIEVVVDSIVPWVLKFEQEANFKLFANRSGFYTKMDLKGLLRGDFKSRADGYKVLWSMGALSVNEVRADFDYNPISEEEGGNKRIVPANMTTLDKVGLLPAPGSPSTSSSTEPDNAQPNNPEDAAANEPEGAQLSGDQRRIAAIARRRAAISIAPAAVVQPPSEGGESS